MKKLRVFIIAFVFCMLAMPLLAQQISPGNESDLICVSVSVEKIYPYKLGYVVEYRKGVKDRVMAYLPLEWFVGASNKAELVGLGPGPVWPSLVVYYKGGGKEFSHLRLYVRKEVNHESWGNIPQSVDIDDRFANITDLKLEF